MKGCGKVTKSERIQEEVGRLTNIYNQLPVDEFKTAIKLIDNLAFMSATLEDLMEVVNGDELVKTTVNASQKFDKEHPALASYNKMYANYLKGIQHLSSLLPKETNRKPVVEDDAVMDFIKNKNTRK